MTIELQFTLQEAITLFTQAGLTVERQDREYYFKSYNETGYSENVPTLIVINPHNGKEELLQDYFMKYIEDRKNKLFLTAEKLDIYTLFPRE